MTIYFSTNIPEMRSILTFNRTSDRISTILQRLETGLRINSAKDDPGGLATREILRADITGITSARRNTNLADGLLSAADGGMAGIASLLYGNPNDSSDTGLLGAIYDDSLSAAAKKETITNYLNMIDNIANSTTYNGRTILNGSLDYQLAGVDSRKISQLQVSRADLGTAGSVKATIDVKEAAEKASLVLNQAAIGDKPVELELNGGPTTQNTKVTLAAGSSARDIVDAVNAKSGKSGITARIEEGLIRNEFLISGVGENNDIVFTMKDGVNESFQVVLWQNDVDPATTTISTIRGNGNADNPYVFNVQYAADATASDIVSYLQSNPAANLDLQKFQSAMTASVASGQTGDGLVSNADNMAVFGDALSGTGLQLTGDSQKVNSVEFVRDSDVAGAPQGLSIDYITTDPTNKTVQIRLATDGAGNVMSTARDVVDFLNSADVITNAPSGLSASLLLADGQSYSDDMAYEPGYGLMSVTNSPITMQHFTYDGYKVMDAVTTGETGIVLESARYGSGQSISVTDTTAKPVVTIVGADGRAADSATGKDMVATVNGLAASTAGTSLSFSSHNLSFTANVSESVKSGETVDFRVTGGGATFQIGRNVTSENQLKVGIQSVSTGRLGGSSGMLAQLRNLDYDNEDDRQLASTIVNEAVASLSASRSRIGAVQKSVLAPTAESLDEQLTVTTKAEALISNADTALESSRLAREELLAESAMSSILYSRAFARYMVTSLF